MADWRDRDDEWRSRRSFDDWRDWRERDRGMEGPRPYGTSMRRDEYAGFPHGEEVSRRDWARDYMPDRGYSAYGGDYRRRETGYGRGYPDEYQREYRPQYERDFGRDYGRDDWRDRSRLTRDDEDRWRERMHDTGERIRERFRGDRDFDDDRTAQAREFERGRYGRDIHERPSQRYGRDDMGSRLSTPIDDDDYPWDRYPEGRRERTSSSHWNEDRERWRNR